MGEQSASMYRIVMLTFLLICVIFESHSFAESETLMETQQPLKVVVDNAGQAYVEMPEWGIVYTVSQSGIDRITKNHIQLIESNVTVDIMLDDLRETVHSAYNTSLYSGGKIKASAFTKNYQYIKTRVLNKTLHTYSFERMVPLYAQDLNTNFLYLEMELENKVLLSVHIKSKDTIAPSVWLERFHHISNIVSDGEQSLSAIETTTPGAIQAYPFSAVHERTKDYFEQVFVSNEDVTWGIFDPSTHYELTYVENIEEETGIDLDIVLEYYDLGYLPRIAKMNEIGNSGRVLELTFQTSKYGTFNGDALYEVLDGQYDDVIDELINIIKQHDGPVLFRPNNEMNGDWCGYNALYTHKDTDVFVTFWRWLHNRFEEEGVENVIWVWNPNWGDFPGTEWNHYMEYFPGAQYVDVIGLTGYNTGTYYPSEQWRSFSEIYLPMIWEYNMRFSGFPYMITEFGSSQIGGDKSAWIDEAVNQIGDIGIRAAVWWNYVDYDTKRGVVSRGYKFDDDPEVMTVFRNHFRMLPAE